jgi:hypothetical protein
LLAQCLANDSALAVTRDHLLRLLEEGADKGEVAHGLHQKFRESCGPKNYTEAR